jgi:hypothetical protein
MMDGFSPAVMMFRSAAGVNFDECTGRHALDGSRFPDIQGLDKSYHGDKSNKYKHKITHRTSQKN